MKRRLILPNLILLILLSGCLAGGEVRGVELQPIDVAAWPTPVPTITVSPTAPVVKIGLPPTPTRAAIVSTTETSGNTTAGQQSVVAAAIESTGSSGGRPSGLPILSIAAVNVAETIVRQGPGEAYGPAGRLEVGDIAGVFGRDASGEWLFIQTLSRTVGWLAYNDVYALNTLDEAPVLPPNPIALVFGQNPASALGGASSAAPAPDPVDLSAFEAVATARVNSAVINLRQRPGSGYALLGTLAQDDDVAILALNRDREWALVRNSENRIGWASMDFLNISGSVANAPQVRSLPETSAGTIAPVVPASAAVAATIPVRSSGSSPATGLDAAPALYAGPPLSDNRLAIKTNAQVIKKVDLRRGPGLSYGTVDEITVDEFVSVRGTNDQGNWVIVQTSDSGGVGWVPAETLIMADSLAGERPALIGWIESNGQEIRSGPGIIYGPIGRLSIYDMVSVLALNESRSWLLIETLSGGQGWLPRTQVDIIGELVDTPVVASPPQQASQQRSLPPVGITPATLNGTLVFQTEIGGNIMVINVDGSDLRKLTTGLDPAISPDGQWVAFTRWDSSQDGVRGQLWVINIDGSGIRVIHDGINNPRMPVWSADGRQIAMSRQIGGRPQPERTCGNQRPPRNAADTSSRHDSTGAIEYCYTLPADPHWGIRIIDVAGGTHSDPPHGIYSLSPVWNPNNGQQLIYDGEYGLVNLNLIERSTSTLTDDANDHSPTFSPDGRKIAVSYRQDNHWEIHLLNADGSGRTRLTETPFWLPLQPDTAGVQWNNAAPVWSPDGSSIAFLTDREDSWEIWVMNTDGSDQRPLFTDNPLRGVTLNYAGVNERMLSWR